MSTKQQGQLFDDPLKSRKQKKQNSRTRLLIATIALLLVACGAIFWLKETQSSISTILPIVIFTVLGVLIGLFQWLFPFSANTTEHAVHIIHPPLIEQSQSAQPVPVEKTAHRGIVGSPPLIDSRTIQQRGDVVREVYAKLLQDDITTIALTGIGGVGKSTLAALTYSYAEEQRRNHTSPFLAEAIWFTIDPAVTFADIAGNLFEALGQPSSNLGNLTPQNQAVTLFNAMNSTEKSRLIILDQFENLLNWDTGHALADRPGVGEWLDILNSRPCACRILLTSRPRPVGTREYPPTYLQEYAVGGLELEEGIALLQSRGVRGTENELRNAVSNCTGHVFSLTLLATLMDEHHMDLPTLFKNSALWTGNIATNILDQIYQQRLNEKQRQLLQAFAVYREPVPLEAAQMVLSGTSKEQLFVVLGTLVKQHLLESVGRGCYQLHAIIIDYAQRRFDESNEQANDEALRSAHAKAGEYYVRSAEIAHLPQEKRRKASDVHDLIEAVWQYCQAEKWTEAFGLMKIEALFDLNRWGSNAILLELCQLLLTEKWHWKPPEKALIYKNLGAAYNGLGQMKLAQKYFEEALRLWSESGDGYERCATLNGLGSVFRDLGQKEQGQIYLERALDIARKLGIRKEESVALINLAVIYSDFGWKEQAHALCEQALVKCKQTGYRWGEGWALNMLGLICTDQGQKEQARDYLMQALDKRKEVGNHLGEGRTINHLGRVYIMLGQIEQGLECCTQALSVAREIGDSQGEGKAYSNLGWAYVVLGKGEQAKKYSETAKSIFKEIGDRGMEGRTLYTLGLACMLLDRKKEAFAYYRDALHIFKEIKDRWREGETLFETGKLYFEGKQYRIALASLVVAKNIFTKLQNPLFKESEFWIEKIQNELGDEQFTTLLAAVEPRAQEIVDQALNMGIE